MNEEAAVALVLRPPQPLTWDRSLPSVFLAGSIEMGLAENWQEQVSQHLAGRNVVLLNPRREEWDASWVQSIQNPPFREQVEWELTAQEQATLIAMYFAPTTKAPITLLELGLAARSCKLLVCCPEGFWRKGNIEVVCHRYGIPLTDSFATLLNMLDSRINEVSHG